MPSLQSGDHWHAKVGRAALTNLTCPLQTTVESDKLLLGLGEADLESLDFTEPAVHAGLGDTVAEVTNDLDQPSSLTRRDA